MLPNATKPRAAAIAVGAMLILAAASPLHASDLARWLHVRVDEPKGGETVRVNLPMKVVESILPAIRTAAFEHGKLRMDKLHDVDLRALLAAVRDGEEGEYVTVDGPEEKVRVVKEGNLLVLRIEETTGEKREEVNARIRMEVLDALLSGEGDELDVAAALRVLAAQPEETVELVSVVDGESTVRIWIDSRGSAD